MFGIIIVLLICIIAVLSLYAKGTADGDYEVLEGNKPTNRTERFVRLTALKPSKRAIDYYRMGEVFDHVYSRPEEAQRYYDRALKQVQNTKEPERRFIVDRMADRIRIDDVREYDEVHRNLPQLVRLQEQYQIARSAIRPIETKKKEDKLEANVAWTQDSQNVHDTALSDGVVTQYQKLKREGIVFDKLDQVIKEVGMVDYGSKPEDVVAKDNAVKMLKFIDTHPAPLVKLAGDTEEQLVGSVWSRIKAPMQKKSEELKKSFISGLHECYNNGSPVCVSGRAARVMTSLAHLDMDPEMGILRTKEALRNEILSRSSVILKTLLDEKKMHEAYNAGKATEFEEEVKAKIILMIDATYPNETHTLKDEMKKDALAAI